MTGSSTPVGSTDGMRIADGSTEGADESFVGNSGGWRLVGSLDGEFVGTLFGKSDGGSVAALVGGMDCSFVGAQLGEKALDC